MQEKINKKWIKSNNDSFLPQAELYQKFPRKSLMAGTILFRFYEYFTRE